jgi:hypothetical protein
MTGKFWLKLYFEILEDAKMGRMPAHLWKFTIQLFLPAGTTGDNGALRPVEDMKWAVRLPQERVIEYLRRQAEVGIVREPEPGRWMVVNFARRQAAVPAVERWKRGKKARFPLRAGGALPP